MQDVQFPERVLDLVNLVLVGLVGPDAPVAMATAVAPAKQQVSSFKAAVLRALPPANS